MKFEQIHSWDLCPRDAIALQKQLAAQVSRKREPGNISYVAGVDVGFERDIATASVAILEYPSLTLSESRTASLPVSFPYIPGLLSFREIPAVLAALEKIETRPDIIICDGQGIAHPRRFGIACHLGLITGIPTIGAGKTRLTGTYLEPGEEKGCSSPLLDKSELIGAVLRTRAHVKPIYVSIGHKMDLETAVSCVLSCTTKYRLPETTRWAHRLASERTK
jgi:deoxyribonuclease V